MNRRELLKAAVGTCVGTCLPFVGRTKAKAGVNWATKEPGDLHLRFLVPNPLHFMGYYNITNSKEFVGYPPLTLVSTYIKGERVWKSREIIYQWEMRWRFSVFTSEENPYRDRSMDFNRLPFNRPIEVIRGSRTTMSIPSNCLSSFPPSFPWELKEAGHGPRP